MPFDSEITEKSRDLIVLEKARAQIVSGGWATLADPTTCVKGATCIDLSFRGERLTDHPAVMDALGFACISEVWHWNDAPERTQAEVLARFDAAIARLSQ